MNVGAVIVSRSLRPSAPEKFILVAFFFQNNGGTCPVQPALEIDRLLCYILRKSNYNLTGSLLPKAALALPLGELAKIFDF